MKTLVDAAAARRRVVVVYRQCIPASRVAIVPSSRIVEPYTFFRENGDVADTIIRCYQVEEGGDPARSGWRFLVAHKLEAVQPTLTPFDPRRPVHLPDGSAPAAHAEAESEGRRAYRDCLWDLLASGEINPGDLYHIASVKEQHAVTPDDIRAVHASVYCRCLGSALVDGAISPDEAEQLSFLHRALTQLGWALGDLT